MAATKIEHVRSEYRCVSGRAVTNKGIVKTDWYVKLKGVARVGFETERLAALAVDKYLISKGKPPVNILKNLKK